MMIKAVIALALLSLLGAGLYAVYHAGWNAREVVALQDKADADAKLRQLELDWRKKYDLSLRDSARREFQIRSDAHDAHIAADGLRTQLANTVLEFSHYSPSALSDTATAYANLFATCTERYTELAEVADRHASDLKTMIDAWPR